MGCQPTQGTQEEQCGTSAKESSAQQPPPRRSDGPVVYWIQCGMRVWDNWISLEAVDQARFPLVETLPCELVAETASGATMHVEVMPCN
jgi:hypothetical protein